MPALTLFQQAQQYYDNLSPEHQQALTHTATRYGMGIVQYVVDNIIGGDASVASDIIQGNMDTDEREVVIDAAGGGVSTQSSKPQKGNHVAIKKPKQIMGSELCHVAGQSYLKGMRLKIGKAIRRMDNPYDLMKKLMKRSAIVNEFAGVVSTGSINKRTCVWHTFRHNLYGIGNDANRFPLDPDIQGRMLTPESKGQTVYEGQIISPSTGSDYFMSPMSRHTPGSTYFSSTSKQDLENLSYYLNEMKENFVNGFGVDTQTHFNSTASQYWPPTEYAQRTDITDTEGTPPIKTIQRMSLDTNNYPPNSILHVHNKRFSVANTDQLAPNPLTEVEGGVRYKANIEKGSVDYQMMNKGLGPIQVTLVVYRHKQSVKSNYFSGVSGISATGWEVEDSIKDARLAGMERGATKRFGSRNLQGDNSAFLKHQVAKNSIRHYNDPAYKFLPESKDMTLSETPWAEVSRMTCMIPSGGRRPMSVDLPGIVYDPINVEAMPQLYDKHSYAIGIVVNGVLGTRQVGNDDLDGEEGGVILHGDNYGQAELQFTCSYTEKVGACLSNLPSTRPVWNYGYMASPLVSTPGNKYNSTASAGLNSYFGTEKQVVILPQSAGVRLPEAVTEHRESNGSTTTSKRKAAATMSSDKRAKPDTK